MDSLRVKSTYKSEYYYLPPVVNIFGEINIFNRIYVCEVNCVGPLAMGYHILTGVLICYICNGEARPLR